MFNIKEIYGYGKEMTPEELADNEIYKAYRKYFNARFDKMDELGIDWRNDPSALCSLVPVEGIDANSQEA